MARAQAAFRRTDLTRALKCAEAAGLAVARVELDRDGKIVIVTALSAGKSPHETSEDIRGLL